jgi:hypothetical protein
MREPLARSKMVDVVKSQETRTVVRKRDGGADAPSVAVAVASTSRDCARNVQTKERRGW